MPSCQYCNSDLSTISNLKAHQRTSKKCLKVQCIEKTANTYNISNNNVKYLVIMACHCNTEYKLLTIKQNIK